MRRGIALFVTLAIVGCASDDFAGTQQVTSPSAGADVNGAWNVSWGVLTGRNTYTDTTVVAGVVTVKTNVVRDSCKVAATLTLTQATGVTYVSGPWAFTTGSYCIQRDSTKATRDSSVYLQSGQIANANLGSGSFTFSLESNNRRFQYGLVQGNTMSGPATWSIALPARPTKSRGTLRGEFTGTK
jgi:hypothetical protein